MGTRPPIPKELWEQIPPAAQAALLVLCQQYENQIAQLEKRVRQLEEQLGKNSTNSSRPPRLMGQPSSGPHRRIPRDALAVDSPAMLFTHGLCCRPIAPSRSNPTPAGIAAMPSGVKTQSLCVIKSLICRLLKWMSPNTNCTGWPVPAAARPRARHCRPVYPRATAAPVCKQPRALLDRWLPPQQTPSANHAGGLFGVPMSTGEACALEQQISADSRPGGRGIAGVLPYPAGQHRRDRLASRTPARLAVGWWQTRFGSPSSTLLCREAARSAASCWAKITVTS